MTEFKSNSILEEANALGLLDGKRVLEQYLENPCEENLWLVVVANVGLVMKIARRYTDSNNDIDDIIAGGFSGLVKAIKNYKPELGALSTYAFPLILRGIQEVVRTNESILISSRKRVFFAQINRYIEHFINEHQREPTPHEIALHFKIPDWKLANLLNSCCTEDLEAIMAQQASGDPQENTHHRRGWIPTDHRPTENAALNRIFMQSIEERIDKRLSQKQLNTLRDLGAFGGDLKTAAALAKERGVSRQQVSDTRKRIALALKDLRLE